MSGTVRVIPTETYFALVRRSLAETGRAYVRVTGDSMRPLLRHLRDGVVIVPPGRVRAGDIVLFDRRNGRYALHRVIYKGKNGFVMAGDNQWHLERALPYGQILGVVDEIVRDGRRIARKNVFLKMYSWIVTGLTFPRIYMRKAAAAPVRRLRSLRSRHGKGDSV